MIGLFTTIICVWIGLIIAWAVWRRLQSGQAMFPRVPQGAAFGETRCTARMLGGALAGRGGVNNCLVVAIDHDRLRMAPAFPFNLLPLGAFEIDVPLSAIARITTGRRMWFDVLRIDFADANRAPIELLIRDEAAFVAALGGKGVAITSDRPLHSKPGPRLDVRIARAIVCVMAAGFIIGGGASLQGELAFRTHGVETTGVMDGYSEGRALIHYQANGAAHTLVSHFRRPWQPGETETVIYRQDDPAQAIEGAGLEFSLLFVSLGLVMLIVALFGARLIPGWN